MGRQSCHFLLPLTVLEEYILTPLFENKLLLYFPCSEMFCSNRQISAVAFTHSRKSEVSNTEKNSIQKLLRKQNC